MVRFFKVLILFCRKVGQLEGVIGETKEASKVSFPGTCVCGHMYDFMCVRTLLTSTCTCECTASVCVCGTSILYPCIAGYAYVCGWMCMYVRKYICTG